MCCGRVCRRARMCCGRVWAGLRVATRARIRLGPRTVRNELLRESVRFGAPLYGTATRTHDQDAHSYDFHPKAPAFCTKFYDSSLSMFCCRGDRQTPVQARDRARLRLFSWIDRAFSRAFRARAPAHRLIARAFRVNAGAIGRFRGIVGKPAFQIPSAPAPKRMVCSTSARNRHCR